MEKESILSSCTSGGCGAKIGAGELATLLAELPKRFDEKLLVGYDSSDDAAVYDIGDGKSLIATVDFFSPMIDDCYNFGRIAATNALSDVYAMGGKPLMALNIVCFPEAMDKALLGELLRGGAEKVAEAGAVLAGGHSIYDKEAKYGLCAIGLVDTDKIIRNNEPRIGDKLILTKALGVGIIMAALRGGIASKKAIEEAENSMMRLNRYAAEKMLSYDVSACTDVTGFGLLVHALEMAGEKASIQIDTKALPYFEEAYDYAQEYILSAAGQRNRNFIADRCTLNALPFAIQELLCDPQTSGGLLIAVAKEQADLLLSEIQADDPIARIVGEIMPLGDKIISF